MKTHITENGIVINTIMATVAEAQSAFPDAICIDGAEGGIGWTWDGTTLSPPYVPPYVPPTPTTVTMRQARLALLEAGLLDTVDAAIAGMTGTEGKAAQIEWEYASEVVRTSALVAGMGAALGMTEAQLDALFIAAAAI